MVKKHELEKEVQDLRQEVSTYRGAMNLIKQYTKPLRADHEMFGLIYKICVIFDPMITLTPTSQTSQYTACYNAPVGTIIKLSGEYETLAYNLLNKNFPNGSAWQAEDIKPGTDLYGTYGPGHMVVTHTS